jgi:multiple sugar transport system substrate-binding protein
MQDRARKFRIAVREFPPFETAIRQQWDDFERKAQTELSLEAISFDLHHLHQHLFERRGLENGDWDVAFISTDWLAEAAANGLLLNLAPLLEMNPPQDYPRGWHPSLLQAQTFGAEILGLPYHDGPECLIYRTDLVDESNLPLTWEEFHQLARRLTDPQTNRYGTVFAAFPDGHNTVYDFCLQLWSRCGELFDRDGSLTLNTPAASEALRYYRAIIRDSQAVHPRSGEFDSVQAGLAFARGEVAMMVNWFGFAAMCDTVAFSRIKGKVRVTRVPRGTPGAHISLNAYWVLGISPASCHQQEAWAFLRHCASPSMDKLLTLNGGIGCRISTWHDAEVVKLSPAYQQLDELHNYARGLPRFARWAEVSRVLDRMILAAIHTDRGESDLLAEAEQQIRRIESRDE